MNIEMSNARPRHGTRSAMMHLQGRALVAAMCLGQVGNLLPHVVVPAIMAQHLMPLWGLSATQAGLMASAYAFGYMLAVPVLTRSPIASMRAGYCWPDRRSAASPRSGSACLPTGWRRRY